MTRFCNTQAVRCCLSGFLRQHRTPTKKGLSYMEIVIALSLFAILFLGALPLLSHAGRNLTAAEDGYKAQLAAQGIMLAVRDSMGGEMSYNVQERAMHAIQSTPQMMQAVQAIQATPQIAQATQTAQDLGVGTYRVWLFFRDSENDITFGSIDSPDVTPEVVGLLGLLPTDGSAVVIVAVWNEYGGMVGRAVGVYVEDVGR
ncbi:MAG: hypothetical protein FWG87_13425 [Defluviitaleaceae bacterium]|nr:hypothetical protein [Defluviitaleaceae bacterium]